MRHKQTSRGLNLAIRGLHDELKSLILTCAANFPKEAKGGLSFLADAVDVQGMVGAYQRQVLVRLFQSESGGGEAPSPILSRAKEFIGPWEERGRLAKKEKRSEKEIDRAVRQRLDLVQRKLRWLGDDELRALIANEDIPKMLYYLHTVQGGLCWYVDRYLARLSGEFSKMDW